MRRFALAALQEHSPGKKWNLAERGQLRFIKRPHPIKGLGAWDEDSVTEADQGRSRASQMGETVHFGRIGELCHETGKTATQERQ